MSRRRFLDEVYRARGTDAMRALYDDWADSYDAEVEGAGYVTPARAARMLARHMPDRDAAVLDFGCGTGLSGIALREAGFTGIDGLDLSERMLARARDTGVYRTLATIAPGETLPRGRWRAIAAVGVVSAGAAPPETLDALVDALRAGDRLVLSFNAHTLADATYTERLETAMAGPLRLLEREDGDHLPALGLRSTIYALARR